MARELNPRFFAQGDVAAPGPRRDLIGYGEHLPNIEWPGGARVALQIAVNYEEGSELSFAMGDMENDGVHEMATRLLDQRDLATESSFEYGSRAGIWRLLRVFDSAGVPISIFATAVALERNIAVAQAIVKRAHEIVGHGYRWSTQWEMTRDEERTVISKTVESIKETTGQRIRGWYSKRASISTRELLVEVGGFAYDSDSYADDLPYWTMVGQSPHLIVPYSVVVNDARYVVAPWYSSPDDFFAYGKASLDRLRHDGDDASRMMSIGLHARIAGNPARADAVARLVEYAQSCGDVWIARRGDIGDAFMRQCPPPATVTSDQAMAASKPMEETQLPH
jgi:peptidoglycan/xylan/chitin deacetylase (PgdA/CDA1 family)